MQGRKRIPSAAGEIAAQRPLHDQAGLIGKHGTKASTALEWFAGLVSHGLRLWIFAGAKTVLATDSAVLGKPSGKGCKPF